MNISLHRILFHWSNFISKPSWTKKKKKKTMASICRLYPIKTWWLDPLLLGYVCLQHTYARVYISICVWFYYILVTITFFSCVVSTLLVFYSLFFCIFNKQNIYISILRESCLKLKQKAILLMENLLLLLTAAWAN